MKHSRSARRAAEESLQSFVENLEAPLAVYPWKASWTCSLDVPPPKRVTLTLSKSTLAHTEASVYKGIDPGRPKCQSRVSTIVKRWRVSVGDMSTRSTD